MLIVLDSAESPDTIKFRGTTELSGDAARVPIHELSTVAVCVLYPGLRLDAGNMSWSNIKRTVELQGHRYHIRTHTILMTDEASLRQDGSVVAELELDSREVFRKIKEVSTSNHRGLWERVAKLAQADQPSTWS